MISKKCVMSIVVFSLAAISVNAATLVLVDGSRIEGNLKKIHNGVVYFETGFAGVLEIPQSQVTTLSSPEPVAIRTESGEVFQGPVVSTTPGQLTIESSGGPVSTGLGSVTSSWEPGEQDPIVAEREAFLEGQLRKWVYQAGVDIRGSDGNSDIFGAALNAEAVLEGPADRLILYGSYRYQETQGVRSEDEQKGGFKYTNFFSQKWGWYVREELERDTFEGIDFRSTTAGGLTYRFIQEERMSLEGSAGISYRYESYVDANQDSDGFAGLDFRLDYGWQFADWGQLTSFVTYNPTFEDFGNYLIEHESGINMPLGTSESWVMRLGINHQYNSEPSGGREKLDTTYFARLILLWK